MESPQRNVTAEQSVRIGSDAAARRGGAATGNFGVRGRNFLHGSL
jgi:hypothetical protein